MGHNLEGIADTRQLESIERVTPAMLGAALLGAARRRKRKAKRSPALNRFRKLPRPLRLAKLRALAAKATPSQKTRILAIAARKAAARKARLAKLKAAVKKSPKLRKKVVQYALRKRVLAAQQAVDAAPEGTSVNQVPQGAHVTSPPSCAAAEPAVEECHMATPAETVENMADDAALDTAEKEDVADQEAVQDGEAEAVADDETQADTDQEDSESNSLTEPSAEEAEEEAATDVEADTTEGVGFQAVLGAAMRKRAKAAKAKMVHKAAGPTARAIEAKSKGKISAKTTLQGCALIQAAKGGNAKAKAAIKALEAKAAKGDPEAKKAVAQLKLCNRVVKKARKTVNKRMGAVKKGPKGSVYTKPVKVVSKGLTSFSAHQRGLSMIPAFARVQFKSVR